MIRNVRVTCLFITSLSSAWGQNEPCHSNRGHGRSTSASGPPGPAVRASEPGHLQTHAASNHCCSITFSGDFRALKQPQIVKKRPSLLWTKGLGLCTLHILFPFC